MTQERVANSVCRRHFKAFVLYNTPFAASIDNPTYGLPTECESFYGGTGSFPDVRSWQNRKQRSPRLLCE